MAMCPICNNFQTISVRCPECGRDVSDLGKVSDYYDDYSPYMEADGMKLEDGFPNDLKESQCPHVFYCNSCQQEILYFISEWQQ